MNTCSSPNDPQPLAESAARYGPPGPLRECDPCFRVFLDHSPCAIFLKDALGRYVYANQACQRLFQCRESDWQGKTDFDLFPADVARRLTESEVAVRMGNEPIQTVETVRVADGTLRDWLLLKFVFREGDRGRMLGGLVLDVTGRRETRQDPARVAEPACRAPLRDRGPECDASVPAPQPDGPAGQTTVAETR